METNYIIRFENNTVTQLFEAVEGSLLIAGSFIKATLADAKTMLDAAGVDYSDFKELVDA